MRAAPDTDFPLGPTGDSGRDPPRKLRLDDLVLQSLMVSFLMIMNNERRGRTVEAGLPDQHHPVQTGFFDAPDKALGDGIQIRERAANRTDSTPAD